MTLVRWNPMREMLSLENEMGRLFHGLAGATPTEAETTAVWSPRVDVEENKEGYLVKAELPGIKLEDIKITVADNRLVIRGEKRREIEKSDTAYHRVERVYGAFERVFTLSTAVAAEKIEAVYRDGVLEVNVPKAEEAKAREIQIKIEK
ncbi:MAG TPA: Hsp20/alpha crystallin family protein [Candidatus Eisenbacteria bacterium]|nr:Hsp20/alpha crystallin family protein [Candidatus Eisenbacteria bacterium]